MSRIYISDTNIWIDFNNAGLLDELFRLPFALCCTDFVLEELKDFDHAALGATDVCRHHAFSGDAGRSSKWNSWATRSKCVLPPAVTIISSASQAARA